MLKTTLLGTLLLGLVLAGCGSNDSKDSDAGANGGAGTTGVAGTTGTSGNGAAGTSTSTAGTSGQGDGGLQLTCDTSVTSVTSCGTETCTPPTGQLAAACQVSCCTTDNKCGSRNTSTQFGSANCEPPAVEDQRCAGAFGGGGMLSLGTPCCTADGNCGISFQGSQCFDPNGAFGQGTPIKCDEAGGDAGVN